jgi:hypothetical protein
MTSGTLFSACKDSRRELSVGANGEGPVSGFFSIFFTFFFPFFFPFFPLNGKLVFDDLTEAVDSSSDAPILGTRELEDC